jgi:hypothetical protein
MVLTDRDVRVLEHIHEYNGLLCAEQVMTLEFSGLYQTKDRLSKLFHNGYIWRTSRAGQLSCGTMVYWLDKKGADTVAQARGQELGSIKFKSTLSWGSVRHELLGNDFTLIMIEACRAADDFEFSHYVSERNFRDDHDRVQLPDGKDKTRGVIPDGFYLIQRPDRSNPDRVFQARLLLEIDLSTHPNKVFGRDKVIPGTIYVTQSEAYQQRFGDPGSDRGVGGRWLVVTTSDKRIDFLKATTERAAGENAFIWYFTTLERVTAESVLTQPIWRQGGHQRMVSLLGEE